MVEPVRNSGDVEMFAGRDLCDKHCGNGENNLPIVFVPYGSRMARFHSMHIASTLTHIDCKFPQCVCYFDTKDHHDHD